MIIKQQQEDIIIKVTDLDCCGFGCKEKAVAFQFSIRKAGENLILKPFCSTHKAPISANE